MNKIISVRWFAGRDCVGIVQVVEEHEVELYRQTGNANFKYYIGCGQGKDEREDTKLIAEWGSTFNTNAGDALFNVERTLKETWNWS